MRAVGWLAAAAVVAGLAGCSSSDDKPAAPTAQPPEHSEQLLKKDCTDQKWREQNLGLWYSLCRQPLHW